MIRRICSGLVCITVAAAVGWTTPQPAAAAPLPCSAGLVALTFDDGPFVPFTSQILDTLAARKVPATFFLVGRRAVDLPALVRRQHAEYHTVANHTYNHDRLTELSNSEIRSTLQRTSDAIIAVGIPAPLHMRPPHLATDARVRSVAAEMGLAVVMANVNPKDWREGQSAATTRRLVLDGLGAGRIIILHDRAGQGETVVAVPGIIDGARKRGYCFGVLDPRGKVVPPVPLIRVKNAQIVEGSGGGTTTVGVPVRLNLPTNRDVTVRYRTLDGTALAGSDYTSRTGTLTFKPGQHAKRIKIDVRGDSATEPDESFRVRLSAPANATIGRRTATVTILNDD